MYKGVLRYKEQEDKFSGIRCEWRWASPAVTIWADGGATVYWVSSNDKE